MMHLGRQGATSFGGRTEGHDKGHKVDHADLLGLHIRNESDIDLTQKDTLSYDFGMSTDHQCSFNFKGPDSHEHWNHLQPKLIRGSGNRRLFDNYPLTEFPRRSYNSPSEYTDSGYGSQIGSDAQSSISCRSQVDSTTGISGISQEKCSYETFLHSARHNRVRSPQVDQLKCSLCGWVGKTQSQKRKHEARHLKAHRCEENGCEAGFGTKNDLERHRKAVHRQCPRLGPIETYKCFGENCGCPEKVWPRLDNFRAHLRRKHSDENEEDLLHQSRTWHEGRTRKEAWSSVEEATIQLPASAIKPICWKEVTRRYTGAATATDYFHDDDIINSIMPFKPVFSPISQDTCFSFPEDLRLNPIESGHVLGNVGFAEELQIPTEPHDNPTHLARPDGSAPNHPKPKLPDIQTLLESIISEGYSSFRPRKKRQNTPERDMVHGSQNEIPLAFMNGENVVVVDQVKSPDEATENLIERLPDISQLSKEQKRFCLSMVSQMLSQLAQQQQNTASEIKSKEDTAEKDAFCQDDMSSPKQEGFACSTCDKTFCRLSLLKKHRKRHEKPYGCTFPSCYGIFGSKADWKRHESTQHYHIQSFRCSLPREKHTECAALFYQKSDFITHLDDCHKYGGENRIQEQIGKSSIGICGPKFQFKYWCGFCMEIKVAEKTGVDALNERFNHIDFQHFQQGQNIKHWVPAKGHTMKGARKKRHKDRRRYAKDTPRKPGKRPISSRLDDSTLIHLDNGPEDRDLSTFDECPSSADDTDNEAKQLPSEYDQKNKFRKVNQCEKETIVRFCCACHDGPHGLVLEHCVMCSHSFCPNCSKISQRDGASDSEFL